MCCGVGQVAAELDQTELDVHGGLVELPHLSHHVPDVRMEGLVAGRATRQHRQVTMSPQPTLPGVVHVELNPTRRCRRPE